MQIDLNGKAALVTGAGAGIGQAIAVELARCGAYVFVNYRSNEDGARDTLNQIQQLGGSGKLIKADVADTAQVTAMFEAIKAEDKWLAILVNNAGGLVQRSKVSDMSDALWDEVMGINLKSTFLSCRAAIPLMAGHGWGRIVNISSQAAHDGGGFGASHYAASKAAVITFSKGLAKELAPEQITVNCVAPGMTSTAFHDVFSTPEGRQNTVKNTPLAREGKPSEIAETVLFLASDMSAWITGETININGGARMC
jgi:3-oxoacyl-[acyl-carrier protein] reductase